MEQQRGKRINRVTSKPAAAVEPSGEQDAGGGDERPAGGRDWRRASDADRVAEITRLFQEGADEDDDLARANDDGAGDDAGGEQEHDDAGGGDDAGASNADDDESAAGDDRETGKKRAPKDLDSLAETLGLEGKDLYSVKVRTGTGKVRTLGELKDVAEGLDDLETRETEFAERRVNAENELLRARQDLDFVVARLPKGSLSKEVLDRAQGERDRVTKRERARTLEVIPEWRDDERRDADMEAMGEFMQGYGFDPADVDRIVDHRTLKMIRDYMQQKQRVDKARERVREVGKDKGTGKRPAKSGASSSREKPGKIDWRSPKKVTPSASRTK